MNKVIPSFEEFLNESKTYQVKDFHENDLLTFKDKEVWIVVKAGMRGSDNRVASNEITIKPYSDLAKKKNVSLAIDISMDYLKDNLVKVEKK
jgi:hypothetical protein